MAHFACTELLEGTTLEEVLRKAPLPAERVAEFGAQIAGALDAAHGKGIVHRDIKPTKGNTMRKLANFELKDKGTAKDPVPGCRKEMTSGGPAIRRTVNNASKGGTFRYDVDLPGGRGMDPEIRVRN